MEEKVLGEFKVASRTEEDETWASHNILPADLRLRVLDSNLVMFDFMKNDDTIGSFRLCWNGFSSFVNHFNGWFFEENPYDMTASCIDADQVIRCMVHPEYVISMTIGIEKPECVFYAKRADVLSLFDDALRIVDQQPDSGCYKLNNDEVHSSEEAEEPADTQTIEERFATLSKKGQTVH